MTVEELIKVLQDCNPKAHIRFWGRNNDKVEIYSEIAGIIKDSRGKEVNILDEDMNYYLNEQIF